jgi:glucose-6-phosphate-specific signal transduction histidine kinase
MKKINIKCVFPTDYFALNPIKIYENDKLKGRIGPDQELIIESESEECFLRAQILFYQTSFRIAVSTAQEKYVALKWKGESALARLLYGFTPRPFKIVEVSKAEYLQRSSNHYLSSTRLAADLDWFSMLGIIFLSFFFGYQSLFQDQLSESMKEYTLFLFIIGIVTTAVIYSDRKKNSLLDARWRIFLISIAHLVYVGWLAYESFEGTWLLFLAVITIAFRSGSMLIAVYSNKSSLSVQKE